MAKFCYAVRKGNQQGIFYDWDSCQKAILGFSGAEFKGFDTKEEAENYLRGNEIDSSKVTITRPDKVNIVNVYTDGSFKDGVVSFGVYIEPISGGFSFYGQVPCGKYASSRNVAGELFGAMIGVELAVDMGYKILNIIYDYQGVASWYDGSWSCNGELQSKYVSLLSNIKSQNNLIYNFIKIKGHTGITGNKRADSLAKRGREFDSDLDLNLILQGKLKVKDVRRL